MGQRSEFTSEIPTLIPTEEGADAASVELMAWRGLGVPLPQNGAVGIALRLGQIQGALPAPDIIGQELPRAEGVLHQAQGWGWGGIRVRWEGQSQNRDGVGGSGLGSKFRRGVKC